MKITALLVKRNIKLFFKDKGMFLTSLITPAILLVLYVSFLAQVYRDTFTANLPAGLPLSEGVIDGLVAGHLISSILAVSCVTVAFCSNFLSVQDKVSGAIYDFSISPVKSSSLSLGYYFANFFATLLICLAAAAICLVYQATVGWFLTAADVLLLLLDIFLLVVFGTALSSLINFFLSTQGQISAVGTVVSAGYGFLCGAYMPIASFSEGLRNLLSFLPGTYGTSLVRQHAMGGAFVQMQRDGVPDEVIAALREYTDCEIYFFDKAVTGGEKYAIVALSALALLLVYVLLHLFSSRGKIGRRKSK